MNISVIIVLVLLCLYGISSLIFRKDKHKRDKCFMILAFLMLLAVLSFREPYLDMVESLQHFHYFSKGFETFGTTRFPPLYQLLSISIGQIWKNDRFFIFITDIIILLGPYLFIRRYSKNKLLSMLLFIAIGTFSMQFFITRQSLAISMTLISIIFALERKPLKFLLFALAATMFHSSAIIFLPVYLLPKLKIDKATLSIILIGFFVAFFFGNQLATLLMGIDPYYSKYIGTAYDISGEGYWNLIMYTTLLLFSIFVKQISTYTKQDKFFLFSLLACIFIHILATSSTMFVRVASYFWFAGYILPINTLETSPKLRQIKPYIEFAIIITTILFIAFLKPINGYSIISLN